MTRAAPSVAATKRLITKQPITEQVAAEQVTTKQVVTKRIMAEQVATKQVATKQVATKQVTAKRSSSKLTQAYAVESFPAVSDENKPVEISIADLANEFDITHRTIRFYEDQGLLTPERRGRGGLIRVYSAADRTRLRLTLRGKRLGFSLSEIKEILDMEMYQQPSGPSLQLKRFLETLTRHREALEQQLKDLNEQLKEIRSHENHCRDLLKGKP